MVFVHLTNKSILKIFNGFTPAIIWGAVILGLSIGPGINLPDTNLFEPDKLAHAIFYGVFTYLLIRGFGNKTTKTLIISFLISSFYGFSLEIVQFEFFPYRYFEIFDIFANIIGSFVVMLFFILFKK